MSLFRYDYLSYRAPLVAFCIMVWAMWSHHHIKNERMTMNLRHLRITLHNNGNNSISTNARHTQRGPHCHSNCWFCKIWWQHSTGVGTVDSTSCIKYVSKVKQASYLKNNGNTNAMQWKWTTTDRKSKKKKDASGSPETEHTIAIEEPSKKEHAPFHL